MHVSSVIAVNLSSLQDTTVWSAFEENKSQNKFSKESGVSE